MSQVHHSRFSEIDTTQLPLVIFRLTNIDPDLDDIKEFNELRNYVYSTIMEKTIIVVDGTKGVWINSTARIQLGKDQKGFSDLYHQKIKMSIMVVPNALVKMMLKGVNLISKPKVPQKVVKTYAEAMEIANRELPTLR